MTTNTAQYTDMFTDTFDMSPKHDTDVPPEPKHQYTDFDCTCITGVEGKNFGPVKVAFATVYGRTRQGRMPICHIRRTKSGMFMVNWDDAACRNNKKVIDLINEASNTLKT